MSNSKPDLINEFATVGDKGFLRVEGPFRMEKAGTVWSVTMPLDPDDHAGIDSMSESALLDSVDMHAVAVADGEVVAGGRVIEAYEPEGEGELHVQVDQYYDGEVN